MNSRLTLCGVLGMVLALSTIMACGSRPDDQSGGASEYALAASDATGVQTTIKKKPANPSYSNKATFKFACNAGSCTYKCSLDSGAWKSCASPKTYSKLSEGAHNFQVKASSSGKTDRTPAFYDWVVDARLDVQGILDNTSIVIGRADLLDRIETRFASLFLKSAQAGASTAVDTILAASPNGIYYAVLDGSTFSLAVPRGATYVVAFYKGMTLKGILTLDTTTDLNSIPALVGSSDFNLGTVSLDSGTGVVTATISQADAFAALGLDAALAGSIGRYDDEIQVKTSVDVDGNGTADYLEGREITLGISYMFPAGESFSALNNWSDHTGITFVGYGYNFHLFPDRPALTWDDAILTSPQDINGGNDEAQCYNDNSGERGLDFYCGGSATTPMPPPKGTYIVNVGTQNFTFNNVDSIAIDSSMNEVFAPKVRLTFNSGKVTKIEWQFYKKITGSWSAATDAEVQAIMDHVSFGILDAGQNQQVWRDLPHTAAGSVNLTAQGFTPAHLRFTYDTISGYEYGFEW